MKAHHYVAIFLRCVSIVLMIYGMDDFFQTIRAIGESSGVSRLLSILIFLAPFLIAMLCWFFPVTVSKIIVPKECDKDVEAVNRHALSSIFISTIGVYVFITALPNALYWLTVINMGTSLENLSYSVENKANLAVTVLEVLLAILLIIKASAIASYVAKRS